MADQESSELWAIRATVQGGVTGYRTSYCKIYVNGCRMTELFETREAAVAKAEEYQNQPRSPYTLATFSYVAEPYDPFEVL